MSFIVMWLNSSKPTIANIYGVIFFIFEMMVVYIIVTQYKLFNALDLEIRDLNCVMKFKSFNHLQFETTGFDYFGTYLGV